MDMSAIPPIYEEGGKYANATRKTAAYKEHITANNWLRGGYFVSSVVVESIDVAFVGSVIVYFVSLPCVEDSVLGSIDCVGVVALRGARRLSICR